MRLPPLPLPFWLVRRIARRNPWLLADNGQVTRSGELDLGFVTVAVAGGVRLRPDQRERLLAERDAEEGRGRRTGP